MKAEETYGEGGYTYLGNGEFQGHNGGLGAPCKLVDACGGVTADVLVAPQHPQHPQQPQQPYYGATRG